MTREQLLEGIARAVWPELWAHEDKEADAFSRLSACTGDAARARRAAIDKAKAVLDYISPMMQEVVDASKPMVAQSKNYFTMLRGMHEYPEYQYVANERAAFEQTLATLKCWRETSLGDAAARKDAEVSDTGGGCFNATTSPATTQPVGDWMPIETAPKDGRTIIAWLSSNKGFEDMTALIYYYKKMEVWNWADNDGVIKRQELIHGWQHWPEPPVKYSNEIESPPHAVMASPATPREGE